MLPVGTHEKKFIEVYLACLYIWEAVMHQKNASIWHEIVLFCCFQNKIFLFIIWTYLFCIIHNTYQNRFGINKVNRITAVKGVNGTQQIVIDNAILFLTVTLTLTLSRYQVIIGCTFDRATTHFFATFGTIWCFVFKWIWKICY